MFKLNGRNGHKSESFIHRSKIPAIEREQMPIVLTYLNEIVAIGELYVHEQFKRFNYD